MLNSVLFIEDDEVTLMLSKLVIDRISFAKDVITFTNGREAIGYYKSFLDKQADQKTGYPQLIFLDLYLPIMNGWEFLDEFNHDLSPFFKDVKVIILSSSVDPDDVQIAKRYPNVLDFMSKPITVDMLTMLTGRLQMSTSF